MVTLDDLGTDDDREGVLIAIGLATGFLCMAAATTAYLTLDGGITPIALVLAGAVALAFAAMVYLGRADWLTDDDQLLWSLGGDEKE